MEWNGDMGKGLVKSRDGSEDLDVYCGLAPIVNWFGVLYNAIEGLWTRVSMRVGMEFWGIDRWGLVLELLILDIVLWVRDFYEAMQVPFQVSYTLSALARV